MSVRCPWRLAALLALLSLPLATLSDAASLSTQQSESERAVRVEGNPAPLKVIVRERAPIYRTPDATKSALREVPPMRFYYVLPAPGDDPEAYKINEDDGGWWYRISTKEIVNNGVQYGFIHSSVVTEWWHREAVGFLPRDASSNSRQRTRFYDTHETWLDGYTQFQDFDAQNPDTIALGIEPASLGNRGFVMPVLDVQRRQVLPRDDSEHDLYEVAFITVPRPGDQEPVASDPSSETPAAADIGEAGATLAEVIEDFKVDVVFCVDASGSMQPYVDGVRSAVQELTNDLLANHAEISDRFRFGLVTFRGPGELNVDCTLREGSTTGEQGSSFVEKISTVQATGGGEDGEDMLGGMALAVSAMDWHHYGPRVVVLIGDEPGYDPEHQPQWNSSGVGVAELCAQMQPVENSLAAADAMRVGKVVISVEIQDPRHGENLSAVRRRQFQGLTETPAYAGLYAPIQPGDITAMRSQISSFIENMLPGVEALVGAEGELDAISADDPALEGIPGPFRAYIEMLQPGSGDDTGSLGSMQSAWISSNDTWGASLVSERFLVTKSRLRRLQSVIELVGQELDQPDVNPVVLVEQLQERLLGLSIDQDIRPSTPLSEVFEIVGGLPIQTPLMTITPEMIQDQSPRDRARTVDKLAIMANALEDQLDNPELWFKLDETDDDRNMVAFISIDDFR